MEWGQGDYGVPQAVNISCKGCVTTANVPHLVDRTKEKPGCRHGGAQDQDPHPLTGVCRAVSATDHAHALGGTAWTVPEATELRQGPN